MAVYRQAARGKSWTEREDMLRDVAGVLGYQRLGSHIKEILKGHMRAAIRRGILESDGDCVRALTGSLNDYTREDLRETLISVMRKRTSYDREDVIHAVAHHLGFRRVTENARSAMKSAINSAIRQGILGYEGSDIWRES